MKRLIIGLSLVLLVTGALARTLPNGTQFRSGSNNTVIASGVLTNGEPGWLPANGTLWVGSPSNTAVKVGDVAWSNNVTASVTNGLASTNFVNAVVAGSTNSLGTNINITVLTALPATFTTLYFTNGLLKGISP